MYFGYIRSGRQHEDGMILVLIGLTLLFGVSLLSLGKGNKIFIPSTKTIPPSCKRYLVTGKIVSSPDHGNIATSNKFP